MHWNDTLALNRRSLLKHIPPGYHKSNGRLSSKDFIFGTMSFKLVLFEINLFLIQGKRLLVVNQWAGDGDTHTHTHSGILGSFLSFKKIN